MNSRLMPALAFALLALTISCSNDTSAPVDRDYAIVPDLDRIVEVGIDQSIFIAPEQLRITFAEVTDSRCPIGAVCFWEGEGIAELHLRKNDGREAVVTPTIRPGGDPDRDAWLKAYAFGLRITLLELEPFPDIDRPYDRSRYRARLRIERVGDPAPCLDVEFDRYPPNRCGAPLWLDEVSIEDDRLVVSSSFSGGCGEHGFALIASRTFTGIDPPTIECWFAHYNIDDACRAIVSETVCFDLRRVGEFCDGLFGGCAEIVIRVHECDPSDPGEMRTVTWVR